MFMTEEKIGILHPGEMGSSVAAAARNAGSQVYWTSEGRSLRTRQRAESLGLIELETLQELCETCSVILSVCPPAAAEEVAGAVLSHNFRGLYLDANAIAPQRALRIAEKFAEAGAAFVDGGIIGPPAWKPATTWLYLSGAQAERIAGCFSAGPLQTRLLGEVPGKASALKMCYAAYTKGTTALLCAILGAAERLDVRRALSEQWGAEFSEEAQGRARRVTAKAWRFTGEMEEISATFREAGLPGEFHQGAAEVYRRLAQFKGEETPHLEEVLEALLAGSGPVSL